MPSGVGADLVSLCAYSMPFTSTSCSAWLQPAASMKSVTVPWRLMGLVVILQSKQAAVGIAGCRQSV